ncbi:MAG: transposase [Clostridia bacterium]|nr:transposase [Clostridia bacterium]
METERRFDGVKVHSFVIMPNHVHVIFSFVREFSEEPEGPSVSPGLPNARSTLADVVGWLKAATTNDYINGVKSGLYEPFEGRLWQRNYYEHIIRGERDYAEIRYYIETNPERWATDQFYK